MNLHQIIIALILSIGIASAGFFVSQTLYNAKVALNTAEAKGLAERRVTADLANWSLSFRVEGESKDELSRLYAEAEDIQQQIVKLLEAGGFSTGEISIGIIDYHKEEYRDDNQKLVEQKHILMGSIEVETKNVDLVAEVRSSINKLIAKGINVQNRSPSYHFTALNDIKTDMLKEATTNARLAANEFAENAGVTVGGIRSARQGSFFIRDAGSEYGDTQKIEKDVRVVTTITFYLTD